MAARQLRATLVGLFALAGSAWPSAQATVQAIPSGFDFPADEAALLRMRDTNDVAGMRRHVWLVFAGMTQPTRDGEAIWETWHSAAETFRPPAAPPPPGRRGPQRDFATPQQFVQIGPAPPPVPGQSLASFTLFNDDLKGFVEDQQLHTQATLRAINDAFPASTPVAARKIPDFPRTAVSLKTVWWIVRKTGLTTMPVWDSGVGGATGSAPHQAWRRCVAVDPLRTTIPSGETATLRCNGQSPQSTRVVSLDRFYHFSLTQAQISALQSGQNAVNIPNLAGATPGDSVALVGFHFTTKEIPDWVWATLWWHDVPDAGPFAANRPMSVRGVWRNYLMAEAYSMDTPQEADGSARVAFNPWLEAGFPNGAKSNCMTCHRRAVFAGRPTDRSFLPVTRGTPPATDPRFQGATSLDFLWSLVFETR